MIGFCLFSTMNDHKSQCSINCGLPIVNRYYMQCSYDPQVHLKRYANYNFFAKQFIHFINGTQKNTTNES